MDGLEKLRKQLIFRSWHRGTREMDLLLGSFADAHVPGFDEAELQTYQEILEASDPDLYNWITGKEAAPEAMRSGVFEMLMKHSYSKVS